jgi:hypothetical protein
MDITKTSEAMKYVCRRILRLAAMNAAGFEFVQIGSSNAQFSKATSAGLPTIKPGTNTSFASMKQIDAGVLSVGYL